MRIHELEPGIELLSQVHEHPLGDRNRWRMLKRLLDIVALPELETVIDVPSERCTYEWHGFAPWASFSHLTGISASVRVVSRIKPDQGGGDLKEHSPTTAIAPLGHLGAINGLGLVQAREVSCIGSVLAVVSKPADVAAGGQDHTQGRRAGIGYASARSVCFPLAEQFLDPVPQCCLVSEVRQQELRQPTTPPNTARIGQQTRAIVCQNLQFAEAPGMPILSGPPEDGTYFVGRRRHQIC